MNSNDSLESYGTAMLKLFEHVVDRIFFKTRATNISGQDLRVSIFHSQSLNAHDKPQAGRHVEGNQGSQ